LWCRRLHIQFSYTTCYNNQNIKIHPIVKNWGYLSIPIIVNKLKKSRSKHLCIQYVPYLYNSKGIPYYLILLAWLTKCYSIEVSLFFHEVHIRYGINHGIKKSIIGIQQKLIALVLKINCNVIGTTTKYYTKQLLNPTIKIIPTPSNWESLIQSNKFNNGLTEQVLSVVSFSTRIDDITLLALVEVNKKLAKPVQIELIGQITNKRKIELQSIIEKLNANIDIIISTHLPVEDIVKKMVRANIYIQKETVEHKNEGGASTKSGLLATALACGCIIVTSNGDMTDEQFLLNNKNIVFTNFNSSKCISETLERIIDNKSYYIKIAEEGKKKYWQKQSWQNTIQEYQSIINKDE
jgi:glycosyltransferase involved in cell wall biosynthesis